MNLWFRFIVIFFLFSVKVFHCLLLHIYDLRYSSSEKYFKTWYYIVRQQIININEEKLTKFDENGFYLCLSFFSELCKVFHLLPVSMENETFQTYAQFNLNWKNDEQMQKNRRNLEFDSIIFIIICYYM